ncbi:hypothetical protein QE381_002576 [Microbacterium sp. SORGH_AS 888]|nr:hypothetical protein [Microbacterium sp. SORGH_AS_0888]
MTMDGLLYLLDRVGRLLAESDQRAAVAAQRLHEINEEGRRRQADAAQARDMAAGDAAA